MKKQTLKLVTGLVRFGYVHIFEPQCLLDSGDSVYSLSIIIKKTDIETLNPIKKAIEELIAINSKVFLNRSKKFGVYDILQDGDQKKIELAYNNAYYIYASSRHRPGVVDDSLNPILDPNEFYSGCYGRVSLTLYPKFVDDKNISIWCQLNNIQKLQDGIRLN